MPLSSLELVALVAIVILGAVSVGLYFLIARRLRQRREQLLKELKQSPALAPDRAYNRIAMARREAEILARQGTEVAPARAQIAQAQAAFDLRQFDRAYELAQTAHETLVAVRRGAGPRPATPPAGGPGPAAPEPRSSGTAPATAEATVPAAGPSVPKNRAESQFQLHLLDQELAAASGGPAGAGPVAAAAASREDARAAFNRADFTEAFRLALKGRRQLGTRVESLPPTAATRIGAATGSVQAAALLSAGTDPGTTADRVASAARCPDCGAPLLADDRFCRGCGRPVVPTVCPSCGTARTPTDTFCGRCGARFS
ncbi:MAG TPA: zinc ribbon domain-containing protein [Thermoplasmata archaeon]|nr:zinc ribbon domain-containing protein [Thermoplasmata archaeon]